ncbi:MAG: hypothetical protein ACWGMZ_07670 [Thermoguttaceae bacterium]
MNSIIKKLKFLNKDELLLISEAIDVEIDRRQTRMDEVPESARRRAVMRDKSYRHATGSSAPPVRVTGLKGPRKRPFAA